MKQAFEFSEKIKADLISFLLNKKKELILDLEAIEETLLLLREKRNVTELATSIVTNEFKRNKKPIAWKFKIDDVLKNSNTSLSAGEIFKQLVKDENNSKSKKESVRKSVSSALSANSKDAKSRYLRKVEKGLSYYSLNRDFEEFEK